MVDQWEIQIPSLTGERKRKAYVYLPEEYEYDEEKRYPVIYMFDGQNLFYDGEATFGKCWGLKDYLDRTRTPVIIAAVECNSVGHGRLSEYSPFDFVYTDGTKIKGKGKKYMDWLVGTFKPYIDKNLRTLPDRKNTAIAGSSMGGLMTIYALAKYNKYFSRGAALSPSLWIQGGAPAFVQKSKFGKNTLLYTDYGSKEFKNHEGMINAFSDTCTALINKNVMLTSRIVLNGTHCEASWEKQIPFFMTSLGFDPLT